jgi:23S rRNA (uracil1939-C5)-methyltransferase
MKLRIEKSVYGGAGLGRASGTEEVFAGKTVFTPLTLAGELIEAHVIEEKGGFFNAELDAVLEPSVLRTTPTCPYFGACGGCSYQHAVYAHQIEIKTAILRETLERAQISNLPVIHTLSGKPWHYRNRIRLHLQTSPFALSYRERRSNRLLPVGECPIAAPCLEKAIDIVTKSGEALGLANLCDQVEFFANAGETSLLLSLFSGKPSSNSSINLAKTCQSLQPELPQLSGAALFLAKAKQLPQPIGTWGETALSYQAAEFNYQVGIGSFFQVNRFLIDALVEVVTSNRSGKLAWDLYAGVGLFSRALTANFERVIAVEAAPGSIADLGRNLQSAPHRALEATTHDFLAKQNPSKTPPDLVVVDPPRAGLGPAVTALLAEIGPAQMVYVSCDPATLSRDLAALVRSGYDLQTITMVDMFPQTFHLESVAVLTRR